MIFARSPLTLNNGNLPLPFFGGNYFFFSCIVCINDFILYDLVQLDLIIFNLVCYLINWGQW